MKKELLLLLIMTLCLTSHAKKTVRERYNFNIGWLLNVGDTPEASTPTFPDTDWRRVTLPHAFNEDEAFRVDIHDLTDTIVWYRKHFRLPSKYQGKKVFIEFEGIRQAGEVYVNGTRLALHENGVMTLGIDLTPYVAFGKENVIAVRVDNNWNYQEKATETRIQWNDRNFNANYGGIPKNVWLHVTNKLYQTLPLYSNLGTTGVYVYASDFDIEGHKATVHTEAQVCNEKDSPQTVTLRVKIITPEGEVLSSFEGDTRQLQPGDTVTLCAQSPVNGLHFWSWGYGYLYDVVSSLWVNGKEVDALTTRTGFRKTCFDEGRVWLNDRVIMLKGYAQRTTNEWPALGTDIPAWMSDFSNRMMVEGSANVVRWMHVTPWKQDVESCDRVGLIEAMPAGDGEGDVQGRHWELRMELMRDAIIYNRNNPSILFYECGNTGISPEHMLDMKAIRDKFDPHGGRAIGSREMLDVGEAEYGGEMLYIDKSARHPLWAMEYCRDEALRKYWDELSYPFHPHGAGNDEYLSTLTGEVSKHPDAKAYNQNQDSFAIEHVHRWEDYYLERPGTGRRVSAGGAKIIFSDSNTHFRGVENYRRSGSVDAMRLPKDSYYAHQVMWDGWVEPESTRIYIIGHWNYPIGTVKPVDVVSTAPQVELMLNGVSLGIGEKKYTFLHSFPNVNFQPGTLTAIGRDEQGNELCHTTLSTAGEPHSIRLTALEAPDGWKADGADIVLIQAEVVDANGQRCPLANDTLHFSVDGPAEWRGGIAKGDDNFILSLDLPVECGVNRASVRSLYTAGKVTITAIAEGLESSQLNLRTLRVNDKDGLSTYIAADHLPLNLQRGETPNTPSYTDTKLSIPIMGAEAGAYNEEAANSYDDNEKSEWHNDGHASTAWITYQLEPGHRLDEVCLKLTGWGKRSYPLDIYAGETLIWSGTTEKSLGYVHLMVEPTEASQITIRLHDMAGDEDADNENVAITEAVGGWLDLIRTPNSEEVKHELRIVEVDFLTHVE